MSHYSEGGYMIDKSTEPIKITKTKPLPPPLMSTEQVTCIMCQSEFRFSYLLAHFNYLVCESCTDKTGKHKLITKTNAKTQFLLKDGHFDDLAYISKRNPHVRKYFGEMKLYVTSQVLKKAIQVWGSECKIAEEKEKRHSNLRQRRIKKYNKKMSGLRSTTSMFRSHQRHQHSFENVTEKLNTYRKCTICDFKMEYEEL